MQGKVEICGVNTSKLQTLSNAEMMQLIERSQQGDMEARSRLVEGNLKLVLSVVQRFLSRGENPDDLFQVGCIGLLKAIANFDTTKNYYLTANAPFQFTKWWTMNLNLTYIRQGQRIDEHSAEKHYNFYFVNSSTTFSLPAKFYIDLSYRFQSRMDFGNCWVKPLHFLNAGIKKRFGDKFTASFSVRNLIERPQHIGARGDGFVRMVDVKQQWNDRSFTIGVTYNFKSGKAFKRKAVEAGSADEKNRL